MELTAFTTAGARPGPSVLITAGMDGDEYTGIVTASHLCRRYTSGDISGTLTVIPLVNRAGFLNATPHSPVDGKSPKLVFPGNKKGTETEQIMHTLYETYVRPADLWIDLHGGSLTEDMTPFVWMYRGRHPDIQAYQNRFISSLSDPVVLDRQPFMAYSSFLEKIGKKYLLFECGGLGTRKKSDIRRMTGWTERAMEAVGMLHASSTKNVRKPRIYTTVRYVLAPIDGFWQIGSKSDKFLGQLYSPDMKVQRVIRKLNDFVLWKKTGASCRKNDVLAAYAA